MQFVQMRRGRVSRPDSAALSGGEMPPLRSYRSIVRIRPTWVVATGVVLRGRLIAAPTVAVQNRYRASPRSPGGCTSPVRHCLPRLAVK